MCQPCGHPWSTHLLGELLIGCTTVDCHCRRELDENPAVGDGRCVRCGERVWTSALGYLDTVCLAHRTEAQLVMRRHFEALVTNAPNNPRNRRRRAA